MTNVRYEDRLESLLAMVRDRGHAIAKKTPGIELLKLKRARIIHFK